MKRILLTLSLCLCVCSAWADEGMWLIQGINKALEKKMQERGLQLSAGEIYNADAPGAAVSDAVISLGFYCTGSMISDQGLLITNHHCAYSDVFDLSTPEKNYLEDGFWAMDRSKEIPIPGKEVYFLKRVFDVTEEAKTYHDELVAKGENAGSRRLAYLMENRYKERFPGMEATMDSMWGGEKYYMAIYQVFKDLRLVAAPPESIAAFGGDEDNWEWPQHKGDFALYRLYAAPDGSPAEYNPANVPLKPVRHLKISTAGYKPGDFTMVIGYPGRTNRYSSAPEINFSGKVELPITNALRKGQMDVMRRWMDSDPAIRLKYSDTFFSLTNLGEMQEGEELCLRRFDVYSDKEADAAQLQAWIDADPARKDRWGNLIPRMREIYAAQENAEKARIIYRENLVRGAIIDRTFLRLTSARGDLEAQRKTLQQGFDETDLRVEKDLMRLAIERYCALMDPAIMGPYQKEMLAKYNGETGKMADWLWDNSFIAKGSLEAYTGKDQLHEDPLWKFLNDVTTTDLNNLEGGLEARQELTNLQREYKIAMYRMREDKGVPQYPDANSTMRISYGTVGALEPWDGMYTSWHTTSAGLLEKYNPARHEFKYDDRMHALVNEGDWGSWAALEKNGPRKRAAVTRKMYINFLTDNDITGGNSGSPVLNARGELIGLAFDGNKESLASDVYYTPGYNMCVNVDIRYVLWLIEHYGGLDYIIDELGL